MRSVTKHNTAAPHRGEQAAQAVRPLNVSYHTCSQCASAQESFVDAITNKATEAQPDQPSTSYRIAGSMTIPCQAPSDPNINRQREREIVCVGGGGAGWTLKTRDPTCVTFHHMCRDAWLAPLGNPEVPPRTSTSTRGPAGSLAHETLCPCVLRFPLMKTAMARPRFQALGKSSRTIISPRQGRLPPSWCKANADPLR